MAKNLCNGLPESVSIQQKTRSFLKEFFFKKMGQSWPLFYVRSFQTNNTISTTNQCEKYPSNIWRRDSNPRPFEHESCPITTRPGLMNVEATRQESDSFVVFLHT